MNKTKIASLLLTLVLIVCTAFALAIPGAAATKVTSSSFVQNGLGLTLGEDYDYSFAVVGDTQCLNYYQDYKNSKNYMNGLYQWIADNKELKNIQYVMGLGDITQAYNYTWGDGVWEWEWTHAKAAIGILDEAGIPYSLVRGNHDLTEGFNVSFGEGSKYYSDLLELAAYGKAGIYEEGKIENTWRKVEIGTDKFLIITFDWFPTEGAMYWAENVINANPDYRVIVTTHHFLSSDKSIADDTESTFPHENAGTDDWGEIPTGGFVFPRTLWDEVLSKYANVEMILCGHVDVDDIKTTQMQGVNGNTVTCMLIDPQTIDQSIPVGMVAMFYMTEGGDVVNVEYISTVRANDGDATTYDYLGEQNQFSLDLDYSDANGTGWTETPYGSVPTEKYNAGTFHFFLDDDGLATSERVYLGSYNTLDDALSAAGTLYNLGSYSQKYFKTLTIYMSDKDGFDATTLESNSIRNNLGKIAGTVELDFGGNTVKMGDTFLIRYYNQNAAYEPTVTIKNGKFVMAGSGPLVILQSSTSGSNINLNFENLDITYESAATSKLISYYSNNAKNYSTVDINVVDCSFDTSAASSAVTLFDLKDTYTTNEAHLNMVGGSVKGSTLANTVIFSKNANDTVTLSEGADGELMSLALTENTTVSDVYTTADGTSVKYGAGVVNSENSSVYDYTLTETTEGDGKFDTSSVSKVFANFDQSGTLKGSHDSWDGAVNTGNCEDNRILIMTKDYIIETKKKIASLTGSLTIDLGGHTLTVPSNISGLMNGYFNTVATDTTNSSSILHITFKNGFIKNENESWSLIQLEYTSTNTCAITRNFTFENITFEGNNAMFSAWDKYSDVTTYPDTVGTNTTATYNNCTFNYGDGKIFTLRSSSVDGCYKSVFNVTVNGGTIKASKNLTLDDICSMDTVDGYADTFKLGKYNGEYVKFVIPSTEEAQNANFTSVNGNALSSVKLSDDGTNATYRLGENITAGILNSEYVFTEYGTIPHTHTDAEKYPFVIFKNGEFAEASTDWYDVRSTAVSLLNVTTDDVVTILLRRDYISTETTAFNTYHTIKGTLAIDLGGHKLTNSATLLFQFNADSNNTDPIAINVKNGSLELAKGLIAFRTNEAGIGQIFNVSFDKVDIGFTSGYSVGTMISTNVSSDVGGYSTSNLKFTDCTIDLKTNIKSSATSLIFMNFTNDASNHVANAVLDGCEFILGSYTFSIATLNSGYGDDGGISDTVKFSDACGKSTRFVLPEGSSSPTFTYLTASGKAASAVKWNDNAVLGTTTYVIRENTLIDFAPKSSVTLGSTLTYNVYIPVTPELVKFSLFGVEFTDFEKLAPYVETLDDGKTYYKLPIEWISASDSASTVSLVVTLAIDGVTYNGKWTMSIPKYAKKLLASPDYTEEEKTLAYDVLAYIKSVYTYFDKDDKAIVIAEIDAILETYSNKFEKDEVTYDIGTGLKGATFALDSSPTMIFILPEGADESNYTFKQGGKSLSVKDSYLIEDTDSKYYNCTAVEISLFAYQICEPVEYYVDGTLGGSYHINAYYDYVSGEEYQLDDKDNLVDLVEKFYNYCKSAAAFKEAASEN